MRPLLHPPYGITRQQAAAHEHTRQPPVVDALIGPKEPEAGPDGTLSWSTR